VPPELLRLAGHPLRWSLLRALSESDCRVRELSSALSEPQNLVSYHVGLLRRAGLVTARRSNHDGRDTYYHLDLDRFRLALDEVGTSLHPSLHEAGHGSAPRRAPKRHEVSVLFVCTGNSARSPMAEAMLRHHRVPGVQVTSAGVTPRAEIHPYAVSVVHALLGVDLSGQRPRSVESLAGRRFDRVVTLCDRARESWPGLADHPHRSHWSTADPAADASGPTRAAFEEVAADINRRVRHLLPTLT
jgi:ArsR family transcriptional regulator, arsenate/arsenite/antimonite-responsive transcriptional repressor / arsenate reductase (thioredoxin)